MSDAGPTEAARRSARAAVKEATARMLSVLRAYPDERGARELRGVGSPRDWPARWCLLAEALAEAFDAATPPPPGAPRTKTDWGGKLRLTFARATDRWPADPYWDGRIDPRGLVLPAEAQRQRLGTAAAAFLGALDEQARAGFPETVPHAACGLLAATDWAGLLLVFATDAERRLLRASV